MAVRDPATLSMGRHSRVGERAFCLSAKMTLRVVHVGMNNLRRYNMILRNQSRRNTRRMGSRMRTLIMIAGFVLVSGACVARAQGQWDSPTEVVKMGFYVCPGHAQIQATWPARCPICRQTLKEAQPSVAGAPGTPWIADEDRGSSEAEEPWSEESGEAESPPYSLASYGYSYPGQEYGQNGYYSRNWPYGYPYNRYNDYAGRPYYNPSYGSYNPTTGYYFNPNTGYYYNPDTRDGYYAQGYIPGYTYPYYAYGRPPAYGYDYPNDQARNRASR